MTGEHARSSLSNIYRTLMKNSAAAAAVRSAQDCYDADGRLSPADRETVALCVAAWTACVYCTSAHEHLARAAGLSDADIAAIASRTDPADPRVRLISGASQRLLSAAGAIGRAERADLAAAGIDDGLLVEIIGLIGLYITATFTANLFRPPLDPELRAGAKNAEGQA